MSDPRVHEPTLGPVPARGGLDSTNPANSTNPARPVRRADRAVDLEQSAEAIETRVDEQDPSITALGRPITLVPRTEEAQAKQRIFDRLFGATDPDDAVRVDRFVLGRKLGAGGMGTVYAGWDEELQREVALKFLRPSADNPAGEHRFYREAQGLARLSHPNVVTVYDVGRTKRDGRVWIAMEYVPGVTLREWAQAEARTPDALLGRWIDAGRGLAAIHEAGLIHRDIKPDNVLVGDDGRVRIVDLGLVKAADTLERSIVIPGKTGEAVTNLSATVTAHDSFVGTPAYAAPEHRKGLGVDARSDQYSFCVAVWEALVGKRPRRRRRTRRGLVPLPADAHLPKRLHRALSRGLSRRPSDRFEDMAALLAAIEPRSRQWIAPTAAAGATALAAAVAVLAALALGPDPEPTDPCAAAASTIESTWTETRRRALTLQFRGDDSSRAAKLLDDWTHEWSEVTAASCVDTHEGAASTQRQICLRRRLDRFDALARAIEDRRVRTPAQLVEWLGALGDPSGCQTALVDDSGIEPAPDARGGEIATLRGRLIAAQLLRDDPLDVRRVAAQEVRARALEIGWRPLSAEASLTLGHLAREAGDGDSARRHFGDALDLAADTRDLETTLTTWSALGSLELALGGDQAPQRAQWAWTRAASTRRTHAPTLAQRGQADLERGLGHRVAGRPSEAESALRQAADHFAQAGPRFTWQRARVLRSLADLLATLGRVDDSDALLERAETLESVVP